MAKGNGKIIEEFIEYQIRLIETGDAGHDGPFVYHFLVLLIGCFPSSFIFISSYLKYQNLSPYQKQVRRMFLSLFWVVLILFSLINTKIIHYSSLCYYPLTFIAALGLTNYAGSFKFSQLLKILYWLIAGALSLAFTFIGLIEYIKDPLIKTNLIDDVFAVQNLMAEVHWSGFEFLLGPLFFLVSFLIFSELQKENIKKLYSALVLNLLFITLFIALVVPKIEGYTQHAAIEFYKEKATEHCYVETHGFKSYAQLFYSNRLASDYSNPDQTAFIEKQLDLMVTEGHSRITSYGTSNQLWMEYGKIDRPAYIVIKTKDEKFIADIKGLNKLYQKNGFSFYRRLPSVTDK